MNKIIKPLALVTILSFSCGDNKMVKGTSETEDKTILGKETAKAPVTDKQGEGITGYWKLALEAYDNNGNRKLDEEERKKGIQNRYSFQFNADGTCRIMDMFSGKYKIETTNGKKLLSVYRNRVVGEEEKDPPPDIYTITSLAGNEMVLLENIGDHVFWVFKKS